MAYDLITVVEALKNMVSDGVVDNYAIGGAIAASVYGEVATTEDVDVFVHFKPGSSSLIIDPSPVIRYFTEKGHSLFEDKVLIGGWPVQFLPPPTLLEEEALKHAVIVSDGDVQMRIFSLEYLAAIALATGRAKDRARLIQFQEEGSLDMSQFEMILREHRLIEKWIQFQQQFPKENF